MNKKRSSEKTKDAPATGAGVPLADRVQAQEKTNLQLRGEIESRAALEIALLVNERRFWDMVTSAIDGICILQDQMLTYVNPQLCKMMECDAESLLGTLFMDHLAVEERARAANLYRRMTSREAFPQRYETILVCASGARLDVGMSATLTEVKGTPSVVVVIHDISSQKLAHQMAIENERLEAVRTMARGVGNNFANILSVINSYAASIADSFLPNTRPHESAMKILDAVRHAGDLTKRLLGVVRVSGAFAESKVQSVEVRGAVRKASELVMPTLNDQGISLDVQGVAPDLYVKADVGQLLDALMNILLNGADAMPQGGCLTVCTAEGGDATGRDGGTFWELSITDTGTGMTPLQVTRAFEPFFTTKTDREAFGLGLSVAQSVVKSWGGWIDLSSTPGAGTCVKIFMLRAEPPSQGKQAGNESGCRTILVVEDHEDRRLMMKQTLETAGHKVIDVSDGEKAISVYQEKANEIDLTVLDWIMPGVDGRDVLRVIHAHDPESRVLMTSGFSRDYVRSQIRMGAWTFLQKPFSAEQFDEAVRKALVEAG